MKKKPEENSHKKVTLTNSSKPEKIDMWDQDYEPDCKRNEAHYEIQETGKGKERL